MKANILRNLVKIAAVCAMGAPFVACAMGNEPYNQYGYAPAPHYAAPGAYPAGYGYAPTYSGAYYGGTDPYRGWGLYNGAGYGSSNPPPGY